MPETILDFPNNLVELFKDFLTAPNEESDKKYMAVGRPLRPNDQDESFGVFATVWRPDEQEIGQIEPVLGTYHLVIQSLVKVSNEEDGVAEHASLAKFVRGIIFRNPAFRAQMGEMYKISHGMRERVQRLGVTQQRYLANEVSGAFLFLSITEMTVQTESVPELEG